MAYENLLLEIREGVAYSTFNRPDRLNALNRETIREFSEVLTLMKKDKTVRFLVLTGTGDKAFVSGADISELVALNPLDTPGITTMGHRTSLQLESMNKPSIAAVNSYALGEAAK
jgi:enoyl-CoA hydratase